MQIIRDTREKTGWDFFPHGKIEVATLGCGDYTTPKLRDYCRIERKATTVEVYLNLGRKINKDRFFRELEKLRAFPNSLVVMDFPESWVYEFPEHSKIPKERKPSKREIASGKYNEGDIIDAWKELKINGKRLRSLLYEVGDVIPVVFCDNRRAAQKFVMEYFQELERKYNV